MVALTIFAVSSLLLVIAGMVLSYMSSSYCQQNDPSDARKYYIGSMVSLGIACLALLIALIIYATQKSPTK